VFQQGMRGCAGHVTFTSRATLCGTGFRVCGAAEWVARRGGVAPNYNYWTNDALRYNGPSNGCWVAMTGNQCSPPSSPMRVCASKMDPLNNYCNWTGCGYGQYPPSQYFGGCNGNYYAGTLCCPQ